MKLVEGKLVQRAFRGYQQLSEQEVHAIYGDPPVMDWLNYPEVTRNFTQEKGAYWACMTYFDSVKLVTIAKVIELQHSGVLGSKSNL